MSEAANERTAPPRRRLTLVGGPLGGVRIPGLAIAALVLLVFAVLTLAPELSTYLTTQQQLKDATAKVAAQEQNLKSLDAQVGRWNDPAYIRAQAGSRLFYVLPGETTYRIVGLPASGSSDTPGPGSVQATKANWLTGLLDSVVTAGTTDAEQPATATPAK